MTTKIDTTLSDEEIIELDNFLLDNEERLSVDEAHGYLTAIVVSHRQIPDDDWMDFIWGKPNFIGKDDEARLTELLQRMKLDIAAKLKARKGFEPLVAETEEDGELFVAHEGWCFGFMLAVTNDEEHWSQLPEDKRDLLTPIASLSLLHVEEDTDMEEDDYELLADLLPGSVAGLYTYWEIN